MARAGWDCLGEAWQQCGLIHFYVVFIFHSGSVLARGGHSCEGPRREIGDIDRTRIIWSDMHDGVSPGRAGRIMGNESNIVFRSYSVAIQVSSLFQSVIVFCEKVFELF